MTSVAKALWYIESHLAADITLDEVASIGGVSRFHMARAFGAATGRSVMGYVRGRRLTEAARALAAGAGDILSVALEAGYGSHEAFTRAFRGQFGLTPEAVRGRRRLDNITLVEAIRMDETLIVDLEQPRFEHGRALLIAGLTERYTGDTVQTIPLQWQRFTPHIDHVPGQVGDVAYGVCGNSDGAGAFDYTCGVEVQSFDGLPADLTRLRIPERRYAVFTHRDHISAIRGTVHTIWNKWLPESGQQVAEAPDLERYGPDFDPRSGTGPVEIWIPLEG